MQTLIGKLRILEENYEKLNFWRIYRNVCKKLWKLVQKNKKKQKIVKNFSFFFGVFEKKMFCTVFRQTLKFCQKKLRKSSIFPNFCHIVKNMLKFFNFLCKTTVDKLWKFSTNSQFDFKNSSKPIKNLQSFVWFTAPDVICVDVDRLRQSSFHDFSWLQHEPLEIFRQNYHLLLFIRKLFDCWKRKVLMNSFGNFSSFSYQLLRRLFSVPAA